MTKLEYIITMIATTFLIRFIPFLVFRKPIKNKFVNSFFYYLPYVTLSLMVFPSILDDSASLAIGIITLLVGVGLAIFNGNSFLVAVVVSATYYLLECFLV